MKKSSGKNEPKKISFSNTGSASQKIVPPGTIMLTDAETKVLRAAGYKEGDPLPGPEIAEKIKKLQESEDAEYQERVNQIKGNPFFKTRKDPVDISALPAEKKKELEDILAKAKDYSFNSAKEKLPKVEQPSQSDLKTQEKSEVLKEEAVVIKSEPEKPEVSVTGAEPAKTHCQHCGWNLEIEDSKPSANDSFVFVQAVLAGLPFTKEYEFLGGKLRVEFRTIDTKYGDMCLRQCGYNVAEGKSKTQDEFFVDLLNYRLVFGLHSLVVNDLEHDISGSVDAYVEANPEVLGKSTPLPGMLKIIQDLKPLNQEAIWRIIGNTFQKFNKLTSAVEARADDSDFWKTIAV